MNTNTLPVSTSLAVIGNSQKPPLTKKELLKVTALAMHQKQQAAAEKVRLEIAAITEQRNKVLVALARKELRKTKGECEPPWRTTEPYKVQFTVLVPSAQVKEFDERARVVAVPRVQSYQDILNALQLVTAPGDRAKALIADPKLAALLVQAGEALLNRTALPLTA